MLTYKTAVKLKCRYESGVTKEAALKVLVQLRIDSKSSTYRAFVSAASLEYFQAFTKQRYDPFGTRQIVTKICIKYCSRKNPKHELTSNHKKCVAQTYKPHYKQCYIQTVQISINRYIVWLKTSGFSHCLTTACSAMY